MTKNPFFDTWLKLDMSKSIPGLGNLPIDLQTVMESSRKTFQALTDAQQTALENMQAIAQRQAEIVSQFVQDQSAIARDIVNEGTPEEKVARSADLVRKAYEKTITNSREMVDMLRETTRETTDIINERVAASLEELKTTVEESPVSSSSRKKSNKAA